MTQRGTFIVLEGPEGAGKSVQANRLAASLRALGRTVVQTREPGGTGIGDEIRSVLLRPRDEVVMPETEVLLLAAGRAQHVREKILPALERGDDVICDRYVDSTLAYQGGGRGLPLETLLPIQAYATGGLMPDVRILLDLPVEEGLRRRFADPDSVNRIDQDDLAFHRRVREAYRALAASDPGGWVVIDAARGIEAVEADVVASVRDRLA
ncbi:MAG TPA: dTMP kinase [Thermomicrobiales bacterium]|nr:dTMP kinase [Thermomicrobiales bacterium]